MNQRGFSLMEVTVSIAIITIGLVAIISLFNSNIQNEIRSRNKLIAVYLANESVEIVRQQRDNNWFKGIGWMTDFYVHPVDGSIVGLNNSNNDIGEGWEIASSNVLNRKVYLSNNSYVQHQAPAVQVAAFGWEETKFTRYLTITLGDGDDTDAVAVGCFDSVDCMEVVSHVSFGGVQFAEVTAYFYNGWF